MDSERSSGVNISDVIEVIETDEMYAGGPPNNGEPDSRKPRAYVKIIEQPASKALRFRYECEGRSAGSIPGVNSTPENKTYPGIQIVGYHGRAVVVVSCVTKDTPYRPHPHNLVGKEGCSRGVCTLKMNSDTITFSNLGIQCVKKKDIEEALKVREEIRVDPFRTGFSHKVQPSSIDLNSVRLCFQVFLEGPKKEEFTIPLRPVVSDPIYDKKAMSDLTICKLSDCSASVAGGKEIILLCEKVAKEDIQVRFYEERDGDLLWEALGDFQPTQVHKQVAISFRTPKYKNIDIEKPVKVWVQLRRPSDGAVSESVAFQFIPLDSGRPTFWSLRRTLFKKGDCSTFSKILNETSFLTPEIQKRKLEPGNPLVVDDLSESKKPLLEKPNLESQKDSLISGGNLIVLPKKDFTKLNNFENNKVDKSVKAENSPSNKLSQNFFYNAPQINLDESKIDNKKIENLFTPGLKNYFSEEEIKNLKKPEANENSQSFNDLISQVAELDEIYAETQERLLITQGELKQLEDISMDCRDTFRDNMTYSSLQLAMKNPVEPLDNRAYEDVPITQGPLININAEKIIRKSKIEEEIEKLPPLPPKRVKKTPPRRPDDSPLAKELPKIPEQAKSKQNIFQRLFSKSKSSDSSKMRSQSSENLKYGMENKSPSLPSSPNASFVDSKSNYDAKDLKNNKKSISKWLHHGSTGNLTDNRQSLGLNFSKENIEKELIKKEKEMEKYIDIKNDLDIDLELTEAENYALYTTIAPHASMTELDEISFYYSPVEKGEILTSNEVQSKLKEIELKNIARTPNVA